MRGYGLIIVVLLALGMTAQAASARAGDGFRQDGWARCETRGGATRCAPTTLRALDLKAPVTTIASTVWIDPDRPADAPPLVVQITAMASSEVWWNGVLLGRNGRVSADPMLEVPGRFTAALPVPSAMARPGENTVVVRLSGHRLWLPVQQPVHVVAVWPYVDPVRAGLKHYLPALLMMGALLAAALYFASAAVLDRSARGAALLCAIATTGLLQLAIETIRVFLAYPYPWQLGRLATIAGLSGLTAVLVAAWAARRYAPRRWRFVTAATAAATAVVLTAVPAFDAKAQFALMVGALALLGCALAGVRAGRREAGFAAATAVLILTLSVMPGVNFLDTGYYLVLSGSLTAMVAAQAVSLARARNDHQQADRRAEGLQAELDRRARDDNQRWIRIRDGGRTHRIAVADVLFLKAADDYCEAWLNDGRQVLWTLTLAKALDELPGVFVRIHRSYVVNRAWVASTGRTTSGALAATLSNGDIVPIGRAYAAALDG